MNIEYVNNNNISQKYLNGKLDKAEEVAFELFLINHPDYVEQLELEDALFRFMPQLKEHQNTFNSKIHSLLNMPLRQVLIPITCCLLLLPTATYYLLDNFNQSTIQTVFLSDESFRSSSESGNQGTTLSFQNRNEVMLLFLYPENELADDFHVSIRNLDNSSLMDFGNRTRGGLGYLSIELRSGEIDSGSYVVEMLPSGANSSLIVDTIPFQIVELN